MTPLIARPSTSGPLLPKDFRQKPIYQNSIIVAACREQPEWAARTATRGRAPTRFGWAGTNANADAPAANTRESTTRDDSAGAMEATDLERVRSQSLDEILEKADDYARQEPMKAVVAAFGAGFLLNLLPVGAIVGALTAIAFSVARPVLLFLGLLKLCDLYRNKTTDIDHE
jgi:hypothetical protein